MMIPRLNHAPAVDKATLSYLADLKKHGFTGDLAADYGTRLTMATDNSVYQLLPQAVIFPRSCSDVKLATQLAQQPEYVHLKFTPRGGGTGTNGQALNSGVVVDLSRYMNRILEINIESGWVRVEAGLVKDQLNRYLAPYGYFFSPELSTSNRATIGGMISTDASGQGSMVYGKTSDHVRSIKAVLVTGEVLETGTMSLAEAKARAGEPTTEGHIYHTVLNYCLDHRPAILAKFPKLNRFLTGYDLKHVLDETLQHFDLTRLLTGSEGSLALVTEAKLNIIPLPKYRYLVNIKYDAFESALLHAPALVQAQALSVETIDSKVLGLAKQDIIWQSVQPLLTDVPEHDLQGINIVEFAGHDLSLIGQQVDNLVCQLNQSLAEQKHGIIGYQICDQLSEIEKIYAMRKKAVGLLGNMAGRQKPIPFVENTCVPPENLARYISEFRALLDRYQLSYGMFGHVDSGVLHVRPALDICDPSQVKLIKMISDQVVELTAKYGGLLWGEHGKGFRSEYSPAFFGEQLYYGLRLIKSAFDPHNRLNPGKICQPLEIDEPMLTVAATTRGFYDSQIPISVKDTFHGATECNGNGLCFNFDVNSPMCPSMKIMGNRLYSPKGRAALVREWLRLLIEAGVSADMLNQLACERKGRLVNLAKKVVNSWRAWRGEYDFSHEVKQSMAHCLSCKACSTQCPIKIDVPDFKARFLQLYHSRYLRPMRDYLVGDIERYLPLMAKAPRFFNFFIRLPVTNAISQRVIGMTDLPLLSYPTLKQQLQGQPSVWMDLQQLARLTPAERADYLLIVQDPFTSYYDAQVVADFVQLASKLGFKPVVLPFIGNGKSQHIKGFLDKFSRTAHIVAARLAEIAQLGIPMVGVDPALVLCYRDEYRHLLGPQCDAFKVLLAHEWLMSVHHKLPQLTNQAVTAERWYLLGHCTEATQLPGSNRQWQTLFSQFGCELKIVNVGCCGMAGTYGHESQNVADSKRLYKMSWQKAINEHPLGRCMTTGYSCRSQVKRFDKQVLPHPLQVLLGRLL